MDETDGLREIQRMYPELDQWASRATVLDEPAKGSELATDDYAFPHHLISQTVRLSLIAGGEHLRLARDAIEARQLYPSAHFTVLRGALVGAAQAVWILAPDNSAIRQSRGLAVIAEVYNQLGRHYGLLKTFKLTAAESTELVAQEKWLRQRNGQLSTVRTSSTALRPTEFIAAALDHTFTEVEERQLGRQLWQQMSADAHVLGWSLMQRSKLYAGGQSTGLMVGTASGSLAALVQPFVCSFRLLAEGWRLFDQRRTVAAKP